MQLGLRIALIVVAIVVVAIIAKDVGTSAVEPRGRSLANDFESESSHTAGGVPIEAPGPSTHERSASTGAHGVVRVEVRDRVRGVRITAARLHTSSESGETELQSSGEAFAAPAVLKMPERLTVEAPGYFAQAFSADEWNEHVGAQRDADLVKIELAPLGSLVIVAKDNAGKVASGVTISLRPHFSAPQPLPYGWVHVDRSNESASSARRKLPGGTTDSDGRLLLEALPTDEELTIQWGGNVQPGKSTCSIEGTLLTATVEVTVHRGVSVRGRFVDSLGAPLAGMPMRVRLDCTRDRLEVLLKEDATFVFEGVQTGPATLSPLFPDAETSALVIAESDIDLGDLRLVPAPARLSGRVIAPEGVPLILMVMGQRGDRREILMGKSRTFDLVVAEGPLQLAVRRNGGNTLEQVSCVAPANDVVIEVDELNGGLRFGLSNGLELASVFAETRNSELQRAVELAQGVLSVRVASHAGPSLPCNSLGAGRYEVKALEPGLYTLHVLCKDLAGGSIANVRIERGEVTDLGYIHCDRSEVALGSDSGGGYLIFPLAGERFSIGPGESKQIPSGLVHWLPERIGAGTASAGSKSLAPGERLQLPPLSAAGRIEGHARAARPVVLELRPIGYGAGVPESAMKRVEIGSSGEFVFEDVEPGPATLCLLGVGGGPHLEMPVLVVAGDTTRVDLVLGGDALSFEFMRTAGALLDISAVDLFAASDSGRYRGRAADGKCHAPVVDRGVYLVAVSAPSLGSLGEGVNEPRVFGELQLTVNENEPAREYPGTLDVELDPAALRPPIAYLRTWNGNPVRMWGNGILSPCRERIAAGHYRFLSIPADAELEFVWMGATGEQRRQRVAIRGGAPQRVALE